MESDVWRGDRRLADAFALVVLLIWAATLTCQGEGPDFDTQRSRHPMWEWLFSHPVAPGAVFLAEMLSPIAANPFYLTAPIFPATLLNSVYGAPGFVVGATLVGIPVSVALACLGKAIEIRALLALPPRRRGALNVAHRVDRAQMGDEVVGKDVGAPRFPFGRGRRLD